MKLSVIIPVYNAELYLKACLDSVLEQDLDNYEVICIDDGSTDDSSKILELYKSTYPQISVYYQKNGGASVARNMGLLYATGKYICFVDSDDMLISGALQRLYYLAEEYDLEVLSYEVARIEYESNVLKKRESIDVYFIKKNVYERVESGTQLFIEMMENREFVVVPWLLLINREWLEKINVRFIPNIIYEDTVFVLLCYLKCNRILHVKQKEYVYRVRQDSVMNALPTNKNLRSLLVIINEIQKMMYEQGNVEVKNKLIDYIEEVIRITKYTEVNICDREKLKYDAFFPQEKFVAACLDIGSENFAVNENFYLKGLLSVIKAHSEVVLYGAGELGIKVYRYFLKEGLGDHVICFAVTNLEVDGTEIMGVPVRSIQEIVDKREEIFIFVTANKRNRKEIRPLLSNLGFKNSEEISDLLEKYIDKSFM